MVHFSLESGNDHKGQGKRLDFEFKEFEAIFKQCLIETKDQRTIQDKFDTDLVGRFLINSWFGTLPRMKSVDAVKPLEGFKNFILQQLLN
ncbi:TetR family transcriptional regulator C-terminal domain-containing protein [Tamlana sp. 2201CG12-4]|uniref:TetR family transcriptional regulator C-terminal domain-containing protein n=1 Tax=Tamlana sp. 2201CG12-4 TaxID=3112582 RepID=UPI002DB8CD21|nr:TetR family transcriptional regulator C-terminal domain-containing protein [Tamlana sp. 2201CG12-4]MEC3906414.1 TetR family transcriptional regulator C-terminal domain-containing protein [Tamlana sp. 2201CG12-4]